MSAVRVYATLMFGKIPIKVGVVPVLDSTEKPRFKRLHEPCLTPVTQPWTCTTCNRKVTSDEVISGVVDGKDVLPVSNEERKAVSAGRSKLVELDKFVPALTVVLMQSLRLNADASHWLVPEDELQMGPYALLYQAMVARDAVAVTHASLWEKQWPVVVAPTAGALTMTKLHSDTMVRPAPDLLVPKLSKDELKVAGMLIDTKLGDLEADDLESPADEALRRLIAAKRDGHAYTAAKAAAEPKPVPDLMQAMKDSIAEARARKAKPVKTKAKVAA